MEGPIEHSVHKGTTRDRPGRLGWGRVEEWERMVQRESQMEDTGRGAGGREGPSG